MIRAPYVKASCDMWIRRFTRMNLSCLRFNQGCVYVCVCTRARVCVCVCACVCVGTTPSVFVWHDSFIGLTWLILKCDMAHLYRYHVVFTCVLCDTHMCVMWHTHVCHVTHTRVSCDTHTCVMGHTHVCHVELSSRSNVCKETREIHLYAYDSPHIVWLRLVGPLKSQVSFAKRHYRREYILHIRPRILRSLLIVANPYALLCT